MFTWSESCCLFGVFSLVVARHYFGTLTLGCSSAAVWCGLAFSSTPPPPLPPSVSHRVSLPLPFSSHRGRLDVSGWPCFRPWHKVPGTALCSSHRAGGEVRLPQKKGVWKYSVYMFLKRTNPRKRLLVRGNNTKQYAKTSATDCWNQNAFESFRELKFKKSRLG